MPHEKRRKLEERERHHGRFACCLVAWDGLLVCIEFWSSSLGIKTVENGGCHRERRMSEVGHREAIGLKSQTSDAVNPEAVRDVPESDDGGSGRGC